MMRSLLALAALLSALILHTVSASSAPRIPLANVIRCDTPPDGKTHCIKYPEWRATHPEVGHWLRVTHRRRHGVPVTETFRYPILVRRVPVAAASTLIGSFPITAYSWGCGANGNPMSSGIMPFVGAISSDVLPRGTTVRVVADTYSYVGTVLDTGQGHGGLDLFAPSCQNAYQLTRSSALVYRIPGGTA